jgi:hypothetical protein
MDNKIDGLNKKLFELKDKLEKNKVFTKLYISEQWNLKCEIHKVKKEIKEL